MFDNESASGEATGDEPVADAARRLSEGA